jgi:hypothetical protein
MLLVFCLLVGIKLLLGGKVMVDGVWCFEVRRRW